MNSIERKQASLERRTRERMRDREDEMESVTSDEVKDTRRIKTISEPSDFSHYYDKYFRRSDFHPP